MASPSIATFMLPLLVGLSSLLTLPLAGPPLPLDPALSAVAPPECIWYASSSGVAEPDASSANQTEQLFAEPELKYFSAEVRKQLLGALSEAAGSDRNGKVLARELPKLFEVLMTRPLAAFVEDFAIHDDGFELQAGLVVDVGKQRDAIKQAIANLVELSLAEGLPIGSITQDGETWHVMRMSMQTPEVRWGWRDNYFVLAIGNGTTETILDRLQGQAPQWLTELRGAQTIERESGLNYLNVESLVARLRPVIEAEQGWETVEKLGLTSIKSFHRFTGFDATGCISTARLVTEGRRDGLLTFVPDRQLSDNDLKLIPHDAAVAAAVRADLRDGWKSFVRLAESFDPEAAKQIEQSVRQAEANLGVNLLDDVVGSLDDVWLVYLPSGDLMTSWHGTAAACKVKDGARLQAAMKTLMADLRTKLPQGPRPTVEIRESEFEGLTIYNLRTIGSPLPISPAWCVTDDWMFVGLAPQTVRSLISRNERESLADVNEIRETFGQSDAPTALAYYDTPKLVRSLYPLLQMGAHMLSTQLEREGIKIDASILPSVDTIVKHLRPGVCTMVNHGDDIEFRSQHSLPSGGGLFTLSPLTLGSVFTSRASARRSMELNNMKQIALAFHNYADVYGKFPTNIYDEDGKALLSWRVRLLPFLEQQALYDQFHLDEPWDSDHNKPLSEMLIATYGSPNRVADGKTVYLAFAGEGTLFPGNEELSFRQVTDGTSLTIMFVQAADSAAVPWSQPKDIDYDAKKPFRSIENPTRRFAVAMCDGSCRWLGLDINEDKLRAMVTRAGGERVD